MGLYKQPVLFALPEMLLSFLFLLSLFQVLDSIVCMIVMGASFIFSAVKPNLLHFAPCQDTILWYVVVIQSQMVQVV